MFRTQIIPAEYLPPADALPEVFYSLPALNSLSPHLNVAEKLIDGALASGDGERVAYYEGEESITYAELGSRINRMGNGLGALGIGLGDRVILRLDDGVELVCAILALQLIGAIPVPTYTLLRPGELTYRIDDTQAVGVIVDVNLLPELDEARASCRSLGHIMVTPEPDAGSSSLVSWTDLVRGQSETCEAATTGRDDIAMIAYTSGTTGEPKGVISTHADFLANAECFSPDVLNLQPDDIFAGPPALPFSIGTVFLIIYTLRSRCAAVLFPKKSPALILEAIGRRRATAMVGVPTFYNLSLQSLNEGAYDLSSLRLCICAGEPMPRALFDQWQKATGLGLHQICGTTEHSGPFLGHRSEPGDRPTTLGIPVPGYHIVVRDPDTFEELPRNSEGLLTLMGATSTKYWRKPEQQRKAIRQGWSVVPDIVTMDEDGYVHYVARAEPAAIAVVMVITAQART